MRYDIYGRYQLEIVRAAESWVVYRLYDGKRHTDPNLIVPSSLQCSEIETYLDDILHEAAQPGRRIKRLD
jgi:hypothetical protein